MSEPVSDRESENIEPKPKPKKIQPPAKLGSLKQFFSFYQKTLEFLGRKKDGTAYVVEAEEVEAMKQQLSQLIQVAPPSITLLINSRNQGAWFGNCALVVDKSESRLFILSREGEEQTLSLKDKILGGLYKTENGEWVFVSAFYGDLTRKMPYRVFWGTEELKVANFVVDRSKDGTVEGQAKTPSGKILNIFRKGRDNKSVQINGQTLLAVFE